jgi:hypothetical protein
MEFVDFITPRGRTVYVNTATIRYVLEVKGKEDQARIVFDKTHNFVVALSPIVVAAKLGLTK